MGLGTERNIFLLFVIFIILNSDIIYSDIGFFSYLSVTGDQIIAINGVSLVGLPLSTCQTYIKNSKNQTVVKLTVVPCAPVVEVKIKRPDTKYQLGFSVQNGVVSSANYYKNKK